MLGSPDVTLDRSSRRLALLCAVVGATFLAVQAHPVLGASGTWYVAPGGKDSNDCLTAATPCQHIQWTIDSKVVPGDMVRLAAGTYAEHVSLSKTLTLVGSGVGYTILDGSQTGTVVTVIPTVTVLISGTTIQHGSLPSGRGGGLVSGGTTTVENSLISANTADSGGGIAVNSGSLALVNSTVLSNTATNPAAGTGGGITLNLSSTVMLTNSTVAGNHAENGGGLWLNANSVVTLTNSTVAHNEALFGGGLALNCGCSSPSTLRGGTAVLLNSTVVNNTASYQGGGLFVPHSIGIDGSATLRNTLVAGNGPSDCDGILISQGYNLLGSSVSCFGLTAGANGDQVGVDPHTGPLQDNGGPTLTIALLRGSPAIDAGNPSGCSDVQGARLSTDQRGYLRPSPQGGRCDVGAYEAGSGITPTPIPTLSAIPTATSTNTAISSPTASATVIPTPAAMVVLSPTQGVPLQTLTVTGTNFTAGQGVALWWDQANTVLTTTVAGPNGNFVATVHIPPAVVGLHRVLAAQGTVQRASAPVTVGPHLYLGPSSVAAGGRGYAAGLGFAAGEQVAVLWNNPRQVVGTATADALGSFTGTATIAFTVPARTPTGVNVVYGGGQTSHAIGYGLVSVHK